MADNGLRAIVRLRLLAMAQARKDLAGCLQAEQRAAQAVALAEAAIERERQIALDPDGDDRAVEAFAAWLPVGRATTGRAEGALTDATGRTGRSRAELAASRAALEAVETVLRAREAADRLHADRRMQQELDEAGQQLRCRSERDSHS